MPESDAPDAATFGALLRDLRLANDLTLDALAERSGVSTRGISDLERGVSLAPRRATVEALATGLGLDDDAAQALLRSARATRRARSASDPEGVVAPHRVNDFTGRAEEVAEVVALLGPASVDAVAAPLVVIAGAPGIGKTTAAWEALGRVADRRRATLFVNLDGFGPAPLSPLQTLRALLQQMPGHDPRRNPPNVAAAAQLWLASTEEHPVAVLLDNAASEAQVRPALGVGPGSAIVVTSRRSLSGLEDAGRLLLGPLDRRDSVALLEQMIPERQRDDASLAGLADICDDIPLALRIAGNRIASRPTWHASDYLERLRSEEDRLRLLVAGDLAVEAAFSLSYDNLDPSTAELFTTLGLIEGGSFPASLAAAVSGGRLPDVESGLDDLTDLGLLEAIGPDRFQLHDLLRLFAVSRLDGKADEAAALRSRLTSWLLATLQEAGSWFEDGAPSAGSGTFADADAAGAWIREEAAHWWPALRRAAADGQHRLVVESAESLHWFSDIWTTWGNWHEFFSLAVTSSRALDDARWEATHLGYVAWAEMSERGNFEGARRVAKDALAAAERANDSTQRGWAHFYIAWAHEELGPPEAGVEAARRSVAAFREAGADDGLVIATSLLSNLIKDTGEHREAIRELEALKQSLAADISPPATTSRQVARYSIYMELSLAYSAAEQFEDAILNATEAIAVAVALDDTFRTSTMLARRGKARLALGQTTEGEDDLRSAAELLGPRREDLHLLENLREQLPVAPD